MELIEVPSRTVECLQRVISVTATSICCTEADVGELKSFNISFFINTL